MRNKYKVNEIFYSLQGEGVRAGIPCVFVRFSACNLECKLATHGFDCDTDFVSGKFYTGDELLQAVWDVLEDALGERGERNEQAECWDASVIFTGGEPSLQLDAGLVELFCHWDFFTCIETNGTMPLPPGLDWVTVSPKPQIKGERYPIGVKVMRCDELKFVIAKGMPIPDLTGMPDARDYLISPAHDENIVRDNLDWCIELVKQNPRWRLSLQQHKYWGVR